MQYSTTDSLATAAKYTTSYQGISGGIASTLQGTIGSSVVDDTTWLSVERICCDRHFGGMPLEDVIAIVRKHAPEYFV